MMNPEAPFIGDLAIVALVVGLSLLWTPWLGLGILAVLLVTGGIVIERERRRARQAEARGIVEAKYGHRIPADVAERQRAAYAQMLTEQRVAAGQAALIGRTMAETFEDWPPPPPIPAGSEALYARGGTLDRLDHNLDDLR